MSGVTFDPVASSGLALLCGWLVCRRLLMRYPRWFFVARGALFVSLTLLLRAYGLIPFEVAAPLSAEPTRRAAGAVIEIAWWLVGAGLIRTVVAALLRLRQPQRDVTLVQEVLGALVYFLAAVAISTYVFNLPIKGLLATSGALAIVVGLALQSSLSDAFSGIVLGLERPYRPGDWVALDSTVQGHVLETNWRTTHIRTSASDLAIIPNSVIAKSKIVNCSQPTPAHRASVCVRLDRSLAFEEARDLMKDVLRGCASVASAGEPSVTIKDLSAEAISFELTCAVSDVSSVDAARSEILRRAFYAVSIAGGGFARSLPRLDSSDECSEPVCPHPLLSGLPLFDTLTEGERSGLLEKIVRRVHPAGAVVAASGTVMQSLFIVRRGVLVVREGEGDEALETARLTPGFYFGEIGVMTGHPLRGQVAALTRAVSLEISKGALAPILRARPAVADQLGEALEMREQLRECILWQHRSSPAVELTIAGRVADTIRRLFELY